MSTRNVRYLIELRDKFTRNMKGAAAANKKMNKSVATLKSSLTSLAPLMAGVSGALLLTSAAKTIVGFEKEMSSVKALTAATDKQFGMLQKQAEDLGKSTAFSAKQAAEGMGFLAMAGFDVQKIYKTMPGLLDLAAAGSIDLGRAADIASNVLTQFGLQAEEMGRVNDVIAKTATSANVNIEQLADSLKYSGTTAKILEQSIEETSAAIGILGNAGLQGTMAGTSLNMAMLQMADGSSATSRQLKELGIDVFNAQGKFVGITNVIKQFEEKNISARKSLEIFGARAGRAFGALLEAGSQQINTFTNDLITAEGTAKQIAKVKLDNLAGELTILKSAAQGFAISMSKDANSSVRQAVKFLTNLIKVLEKNRRAIKFVIKAFIVYKGAMIAYTMVTRRAMIATKALSLVMKANPYALAATGLLLLIQRIRRNRKETKRATDQQREYNDQLRYMNQLIANGEQVFVIAQQGLEGLAKISINELQAGLDVAREALNNFREDITAVTLPSGQVIQIDVEGNKKRIVSAMKRIQSELDRRGISAMMGDPGKTTVQQRKTTITSRSPKVINININKLIETQEINTKVLSESTSKIKSLITQTILEAINDTQISQRAS